MMTKDNPQLMTEHDVAQLLKISVATLRRRRLFQQPPQWLKIGASVRYSPETIRRFIQDHEKQI
jgi:predicted DNA-binding transcriptional regulator AlpA